jgi:hypothetical protein
LNRKAAQALALRPIFALTLTVPLRIRLMPGRISRWGCRPATARANRHSGHALAFVDKARELLSPQPLAAMGADRYMLITTHHAGDDLHPVAQALSIAAVRATRPRREGFR